MIHSKIFLLSLLFLATNALAWPENKGDFEKHKQHMLKEMEEQISSLQNVKSCISSASDHEGVKRCHEALEKARKQHRAHELDERIHSLEEEKAKLSK